MPFFNSIAQASKQLFVRWRKYQRENYALWKALPLAGAMSYSAIRFPALASHRDPPSLWVFFVGFTLMLLIRFQRRIVEDLSSLFSGPGSEDLGLKHVTPNELRLLFVLCIPVQVLLCFFLDEELFKPLLMVTLYMLFLTFGVGPLRWNPSKPWPYLILHRSAAPLTFYVVSACEWIPRHNPPPLSLALLLMLSFANSFVHDIGRHFDLSRYDHRDVRSFTGIWGSRRSVLIWWMLINASAIIASLARWKVGASMEGIAVLLTGVVLTGLFAYQYAVKPHQEVDRRFEFLSVAWSVSMFLTLVMF